MQTPPASKNLAVGIVLLGSLLASSAAIWIRFIPDESPLAIGFIRVAGASIIFFPLFWQQLARGKYSLYDFRFSFLAGIALALHFATWIASLWYTTVANSVLFVATHPLFVILITLFILREKVARNQISGTLIALSGIVFIQWNALSGATPDSLTAGSAWGNFLALSGGLFGAIYVLLGRKARQTLGTIMHVEVTYGSAAVVLLALALGEGSVPVPTTVEPWLFLGLLVLLPTVGGHTIFNWGVKHLGAPLVSLMGLLEPVESAFLALLLLGESVGTVTLIGGILTLGGLFWAVKPERLTS